MLPFVGVDGEGGDIEDATGFTTHQYTMLRAGDRYVTADQYTDDPIYDPWLPFLAALPKGKIHVAYFFDYDVTMMLRNLPMHLLQVLISGQEIIYGPYRISYRPRKELIVKRYGRMTTINDVGTFFQSTFVTALERWGIGTSEQRDLIGSGKEQRATFGHLTADTVRYNGLECELLVALMDKFRASCQVLGYLPRRWQGPGQLAKAMFRTHSIPTTANLPEPPPGVWAMAQAAYYGGRFETSAVGPVRGPVEGYDINSAYPYACTLLPCLDHGNWRPSRDLNADHAMFSASFMHRGPGRWYGLPLRTSTGAIRFPRNGSGWYWSDELRSAQALGADITIHDGWEYVKQCDCRPFEFMHRLYSLRQGMGKTEAGYTVKLAMNSAYGITAQSIGKAPYANPVWAGRITAITRARLNHALALDSDAVFMLATDGIFTRAGYPLEESPGLGGWEKTVYPDGMHIVQPGVYFVGHKSTCTPPYDCKCAPKTRGVPQSAIVRNEKGLRDAWNGKATDGLPIELRGFTGLRLAVAQNAMHRAGQWLPVEKRVTYDWSTKRRPNITRRSPDAVRTVPYDGSTDDWTIPYDRLIGGNLLRDEDRLQYVDTPDWAETLTELL